MKYYKSLTAEHKGPFSEFDFTPYLPHDGQPGEWLPKVETLSLCQSGWHCADEGNIIEWLNAEIYEVEISGDSETNGEKIAAQGMRLLRKCAGWNERTARLYACDCAERVLHIFEKKYPDDNRPRKCIETVRRYANGEATRDELAAAWDAARDAAWDAACDAWDAAWDAARDAAWDAARDAARDAAWDARDAANAAAWAAERKWQNDKLLTLLDE